MSSVEKREMCLRNDNKIGLHERGSEKISMIKDRPKMNASKYGHALVGAVPYFGTLPFSLKSNFVLTFIGARSSFFGRLTNKSRMTYCHEYIANEWHQHLALQQSVLDCFSNSLKIYLNINNSPTDETKEENIIWL